MIGVGVSEVGRGSWNCMIEHRDGGIICYTEGYVKKSDDNGRTWNNLYPETEGMSVNLLRLKDGRLLSVRGFQTENALGNSLKAENFYAYFSDDEGKTWKDRVVISDNNRRLYLMNDRLVRLANGRILIIFGIHPDKLLDKGLETVGWFIPVWSDDEGKTWHEEKAIQPRVADQLCEPMVFQREDGSLKMLARTGVGYLYQCDSYDNGVTWTCDRPTTLRSPCAPFAVRKDPYSKYVFAAWDNSFPANVHQYPRCPLSLAVSRDDGETWGLCMDIENNPMLSYGYPNIYFTEKEILISYYEQTQGRAYDQKAFRNKLTIIDRKEIKVDVVEKKKLF